MPPKIQETMDAYDSDPDESQPTQMLQELLEHDVMKNKKAGKSRSSVLQTQPAQSNEVSSDSFSSSRASNSIPQYNLHGLACTQSQQHREEDEVDEGSQKENIASSRLGRDAGRSNASPDSRPGSPQPSSSSTHAQAKTKQAERFANAASGNDKVANKLAAKVAFQPPQTKSGLKATTTKPFTRFSPYKPPPQAPSRYKQPPRPISPSSQDSFAGDLDDNEERFLARSEKFAVPLSELGQGSSPARGPQDTNGGTSTSSMYAYPTPGRRQHVPSSPPTGRVLVEATPSDSSQSQDEAPNATHEWVETQPSGDPDPIIQRRSPPRQAGTARAGNLSDSDSEPSSSVERVLRGEDDPTPATELVATQPDDSDIHEMDRQTGQTSSMRPSTTAGPSTGPRSLLSMIAPEKRYRYRGFIEQQQSNANTLRDNRVQQAHDPAIGQETQPSTQPTFPVPRARTPAENPAPRPPATNRAQQASRESSPLSMDVDDVDVIPDSEPQRDDRNPGGNARGSAPSKRVAPPAVNKAPANSGNRAGSELTPLPEDMEEEEEEEEEDVPLAARQPRGRPKPPANKGKGKAKEDMPPPKAPAKSVQNKAPAPPAKPKGRAAAGPKASTSRLTSKTTGGSWETGIVPSSVPEQDVSMTKNDPPARGNTAGSSKATRQRSTSAAPKSGLRQGPTAEDLDNGSQHGDDDNEEVVEEPGPSRKRKRGVANKPASKKVTKTASKRVKQEAATPAASTRQAKKLRSATSQATLAPNAPATRVVALWKQDGHFYPGTVHSIAGHGRYKVTFDDGTSGEVTIEQIRLCRLNVGDDVLYSARNRPAKVIAVDDEDDPTLITVDADDEEEEVKIGNIRIASKTITYAWEDRILNPEDVVPEVKPVKPEPSPAPSNATVASLNPAQGPRKKFLDKTGLIVTLCAVSGNHEKEKDKVSAAIMQGGGSVVEDFSNVIRMEGKHVGNSWVLEKGDVQWIGKPDIQRLFLVADDSNQKAKFLIALALGIPCVGTNWLFESVQSGQEKDWLGYMLPQGFSAHLSARPSQQVDVDWGNSIHQLKHIMNNAVPRKLFAGMSILCIGPDIVRQPKNKRKAGTEDKMEGSNVIPQIILAMGADRVEAVTEARYATQALTDYNYIVIREENQYSAEYAGCVTVDWTWVKESLIASRELPLPAWNEQSQEA